MDKLETIANKNHLDENQVSELKKVCYMYKFLKKEIRSGSLHEEKYNTYSLSYLAKRIKQGETPLEIMNNIIDECEEYSRAKIFEEHLGNSKN